jgi:hypothetical protein
MNGDFHIELSVGEHAKYAKQWEMLAIDLRAAGYSVELSEPYADRSARDIATYIAIVVAVADHTGLDEFTRTTARRLWGKIRGKKRRVVIIDRQGHVLTTIDVREDEPG